MLRCFGLIDRNVSQTKAHGNVGPSVFPSLSCLSFAHTVFSVRRQRLCRERRLLASFGSFCTNPPTIRFSEHPSARLLMPPRKFRHHHLTANAFEPVSALPNQVSQLKSRISKNCRWRLKAEGSALGAINRGPPPRRPTNGVLTGGNVAAFPFARNRALETALAGWGARIRTWEWRNQNPLPYHLATPQYRRIGAGRLGRPPHHSDGACTKQYFARPRPLSPTVRHHIIMSRPGRRRVRRPALRIEATPCPIPSS